MGVSDRERLIYWNLFLCFFIYSTSDTEWIREVIWLEDSDSNIIATMHIDLPGNKRIRISIVRRGHTNWCPIQLWSWSWSAIQCLIIMHHTCWICSPSNACVPVIEFLASNQLRWVDLPKGWTTFTRYPEILISHILPCYFIVYRCFIYSGYLACFPIDRVYFGSLSWFCLSRDTCTKVGSFYPCYYKFC